MRITIHGDLYYVRTPELYVPYVGPGGPLFVDVDGRIRPYEPGLSLLRPGDVILKETVSVWTITQHQRLRREREYARKAML